VRQVMLVVALVGASFLGGAYINGPGLQWAQSKVLHFIGLDNGGEITSVDLKPAVASDGGIDRTASARPGNGTVQGPVAPMPSLVAEDESPGHVTSNHQSTSRADQKSPSERPGSRPSQRPPSSGLLTKGSPAAGKPSTWDNAPSDTDVARADMTSMSTPARGVLPRELSTGLVALDSLATQLSSDSSSSGSGSVSPASSSPVATPTLRSATNRSDAWVVLERRMRSLGVSRFMVEGEPGGRAVFACLVPLAGRQAVTQRFEAVGDDVVEAARAAVGRITLWRATQPSSQ
jgi:hypothetical protein